MQQLLEALVNQLMHVPEELLIAFSVFSNQKLRCCCCHQMRRATARRQENQRRIFTASRMVHECRRRCRLSLRSRSASRSAPNRSEAPAVRVADATSRLYGPGIAAACSLRQWPNPGDLRRPALSCQMCKKDR